MAAGGARPGAGRKPKPETIAKNWRIERGAAAEIERLAIENRTTNGEMIAKLLEAYKSLNG